MDEAVPWAGAAAIARCSGDHSNGPGRLVAGQHRRYRAMPAIPNDAGSLLAGRHRRRRSAAAAARLGRCAAAHRVPWRPGRPSSCLRL